MLTVVGRSFENVYSTPSPVILKEGRVIHDEGEQNGESP